MTASLLSNSALELQPSVFSQLTPKIKELGERCIPLHIGDTYRLPPVAARRAVREAVEREIDSTRYFKYTHPAGMPPLLEALVKKLDRDNRMTVTPAQLQVTCGATQALCSIAQTVLNPGDEVIVLCPHWPLIRGIVQSVGGKVVDAPFTEAVADPEKILAPLLTERTKAIYFANPNNPDGQLLERAQCERLYEFCCSRDLSLWSDEAYEHIVFDGHEKFSMGALDSGRDKPRVLSVFTFSKSFGMAGMRMGYVVGPSHQMDYIRRVSTHQVYDLCELNQVAALACLTQPEDEYQEFLAKQRDEYQKARDLLHGAFPDCPLSPGGAYLFVPFENRDAAWRAMSAWLEEGVSSAPGEAFGGLHPHCLRLCFTAVPYQRLEEAVEIIKRVDPGC